MGLRDGIASFETLSSTFSGTNISTSNFSGINFSSISGVNVFTTGSITTADTLGNVARILPVTGGGSPAVYNQLIQAGSSVTTAGSIGVAIFGQPFVNTNYYVTFGGRIVADTAGSTVPFTSGTRGVGSVVFVASASKGYDWITVGQI